MKISQLVAFVFLALASMLSIATSSSTGMQVEPQAQLQPARPGAQGGVGVYEDGLPYCQNNLDCDGVGNWCRDRGDGIQLCMSRKGRAGDFCKSGIDCGRRLFCKDRGDGLKQCMGNKQGRKGSFCSSSLDCGRRQFCKDRGDGMKVCM